MNPVKSRKVSDGVSELRAWNVIVVAPRDASIDRRVEPPIIRKAATVSPREQRDTIIGKNGCARELSNRRERDIRHTSDPVLIDRCDLEEDSLTSHHGTKLRRVSRRRDDRR